MNKPKKKKEKSQAKYRQECVKVAKLIAKHRDRYRCQVPGCARSAKSGYQMHGSHIFPEGKFHSMSAETDNIETLCARHHMDWHENPIASVERLKKQKPELYKELSARSLIDRKVDYKALLSDLKAEYQSMIS
jgi:hypothetical protein